MTETFNRVRAGGATGPLTLPADSGFYIGVVVAAYRKADARFSITAATPASTTSSATSKTVSG